MQYKCEKCGHQGRMAPVQKPGTMKAFTVRGIWGFAILRLGKRIENRKDRWEIVIDQWVALHVGLKMGPDGSSDDGSCMKVQMLARERGIVMDVLPEEVAPLLGRVVALVHISKIRGPVTDDQEAPLEPDWWEPYNNGMEIADIIELDRPVKCKGGQGAWTLSGEEYEAVRNDPAVLRMWPKRKGEQAA